MAIVVQHAPAQSVVAKAANLAGLGQYGQAERERQLRLEAQQREIDAQAARQAEQIGSNEYLTRYGSEADNFRLQEQIKQQRFSQAYGAADGQFQQARGIEDAQFRQGQSLSVQQQIAAADAQARAQQQQAQIAAGERMAQFDLWGSGQKMGYSAWLNSQQAAQDAQYADYARNQTFGHQDKTQAGQQAFQQSLSDQEFQQRTFTGGYAPAWSAINAREQAQKQNQLKSDYQALNTAHAANQIDPATYQMGVKRIQAQQMNMEQSFLFDAADHQAEFEKSLFSQTYTMNGPDGQPLQEPVLQNGQPVLGPNGQPLMQPKKFTSQFYKDRQGNYQNLDNGQQRLEYQNQIASREIEARAKQEESRAQFLVQEMDSRRMQSVAGEVSKLMTQPGVSQRRAWQIMLPAMGLDEQQRQQFELALQMMDDTPLVPAEAQLPIRK